MREDRVDMEIVGYHLSRRLEVELLDISKFAELIADLAKLDNVSSLNADFDVTNRDSIELKLMNEAGADARRNAENMVHGMSRTVGAVYSVSESSIHSSSARYALGVRSDYPMARIGMAPAYQETVFEPSTIELRQSIHVMFELR